jgi:thymidylate synthase
MLNPIAIRGTNLPDIWHQAVYKIVEEGRDFTIDQGSFAGQKRKEFDYITLHATCPGTGELLPKLNPALNLDDPCSQNFLDQYLPYLMTDEEKENESYTYGQRITHVKLNDDYTRYINPHTEQILIKDIEIWEQDNIISNNNKNFFLSQLELMIWTYKNKGYRNNQMILQVGQPSDMMLQDPPCLRHIDTRIQDGKLHFFPYFRSWDLWGGMPANLAAIELMKQYAAAEIGVENGEIIASSKGCHIYSYLFEIAEIVRGRSCEEFKKEMER